MNYTIQYHPETASDLLQITRWLIAFSGPEVAAHRIEQITAAARSLTSFPHRATERKDVAPKLRVIMAADQNAVLAYTVHDATSEVLIVAVSYAGEDWMAKSKSRLN